MRYGAASDFARNDKRLFLRFRHSFLGGFETDLGMCAVAKGFFGRCAATAKRHSFFHRKLVAVGVDQLHFAGYNVWAVLDCFDCYVSHVGILVEVDRVVLNATLKVERVLRTRCQIMRRRSAAVELPSSSEKPIHLDL